MGRSARFVATTNSLPILRMRIYPSCSICRKQRKPSKQARSTRTKPCTNTSTMDALRAVDATSMQQLWLYRSRFHKIIDVVCTSNQKQTNMFKWGPYDMRAMCSYMSDVQNLLCAVVRTLPKVIALFCESYRLWGFGHTQQHVLKPYRFCVWTLSFLKVPFTLLT